jgi:hypothetical protein
MDSNTTIVNTTAQSVALQKGGHNCLHEGIDLKAIGLDLKPKGLDLKATRVDSKTTGLDLKATGSDSRTARVDSKATRVGLMSSDKESMAIGRSSTPGGVNTNR